MTNPIKIAVKAKGPFALYKRSLVIAQRYGLTATQMDRALMQFFNILKQFDCGATLPITAITLKRHEGIINKYLGQNIEFAVHGYSHVDYSSLTPEEQLAHLYQAHDVFTHAGIKPEGFRSPYLRRDDHLYKAIKKAGFSYVSNQPILWDVLDNSDHDPSKYTGYEQALEFYKPWRANYRSSLPRINDQLVEIPVSLPDDEILVERLGNSNGLVKETWLEILAKTYKRGELFTLQLHPERIRLCADGLSAVLAEAHRLTPLVWIARMDEIATWWKARLKATIEVSKTDDGRYHCVVSGPNGTTVLVRAVDIDVPSTPWNDDYRQVDAMDFTVRTTLRPFIGLSPSTSKELVHFLRQQGYIIEINPDKKLFPFYIDMVNFDGSQERAVLDQIEKSRCPLVRLGRWPHGVQSALVISGDIDAMSLLDFGLRFVGR